MTEGTDPRPGRPRPTGVADLERAALAAISAGRIVADLAALVAIPSVTGMPATGLRSLVMPVIFISSCLKSVDPACVLASL